MKKQRKQYTPVQKVAIRSERMQTLKNRHAVHGGYIVIKENGSDREGWNLVLVRPPESMYREWRIMETRLSVLTGRATRYEPRRYGSQNVCGQPGLPVDAGDAQVCVDG